MSMNNPAGAPATGATGQQPGANQQPQSQGPNDVIQPPASGGQPGQVATTDGQEEQVPNTRQPDWENAARRAFEERDAARRELEALKRQGLSAEEKQRLEALDAKDKERDAREKTLVLKYEIAAKAPALGIIDPELAVLLLTQSGKVTVNDDLTVSGLDEALKALIKERPHLVRATRQDVDAGAGTGGSRGAGASKSMNDFIRGKVRGEG